MKAQNLGLHFFGDNGAEWSDFPAAGGAAEVATAPEAKAEGAPVDAEQNAQTPSSEAPAQVAAQSETKTEEAAAEPTAPPATEETPEQLEAEYRKLTRGKFKSFFKNDTQNLIDKRFAETKTLKETQGKVMPVLETIAEKLGVHINTVDDYAKLTEAIEEMGVDYAQEAIETGKTEAEVRAKHKLDREKQRIAEQRTALEREARARENNQRLVAEGVALKEKYPDFDLEEELTTNTEFFEALKRLNSVEEAYKLTHFEELVKGTADAAVEKAREEWSKTTQARGRAPENATKQQPGSVSKVNLNTLKKEEIDDIWAKLGNGTTIEQLLGVQ